MHDWCSAPLSVRRTENGYRRACRAFWDTSGLGCRGGGSSRMRFDQTLARTRQPLPNKMFVLPPFPLPFLTLFLEPG